ncbi:MAG: hypothetical protein AAGF07_01700 [Patescibacteria group bacterium]
MKIYNGTTHQINFYSESQTTLVGRKLVVKEGEKPLYSLSTGEKVLGCVKYDSTTPEGLKKLPFMVVGAQKFKEVDPLPPGYDLYIVSNIYRSAVQANGGDTSKLGVVSGVVGDSEGRACGCLKVAVG